MRIPITVQPLFWLFAALIGYLNSQTLIGTLIWIAVIFISILIHECGHALTGLAFRQKVHIQIAFFGGVTTREGDKLSLGKEFLIVLAGPIAGLVLCGLAYIVLPYAHAIPSLAYGLKAAVQVNLIWTVLNLVPVLPLDGGKLFGIILEALFGFKGFKFSIYTSVVLGLLLALSAFLYGYLFVGVIFFLLTFESMRSLKYARMMSDQDRDLKLQSLFEEAQRDYEEGHVETSFEKFQQVRSLAKNGVLYLASTETLAQLLFQRGDKEEAYRFLLPVEKNLSEVSLPLLHRLAFEHGDYGHVIRLGDKVFQMAPTASTAIMNAMAFASQGRAEPSVGWLERALQEGVTDFQTLLSQKEFDAIRSAPSFQQLLDKRSD